MKGGRCMKKKKGKETASKKESMLVLVLVTILSIIALISSGFFIYHIFLLILTEPIICYIMMLLLAVIDLALLFYLYRLWKKKTKKKRVAFYIGISLYILLSIGGSLVINYLYSHISLSHDYITYSTSLVALKDSSFEKLEDVNNLQVGIVPDTNAEYAIAKEIIEENKLEEKNTVKEYEDFPTMINALFDKEVDVIFLSSNYVTNFQAVPGFEDIGDTTKVIYSKEKEMKNEDLLADGSDRKPASVTEPFTVLLMGVDSEVNGMDKNAAFNGDSLILVTFNPKTLTATTLSIPRDSYVPIACFANQKENKITHAAWYGANCMMRTIEGFTGIDIDYYVKVNFKAVVQLVDALGGVEIDVPYSFCEQNSDRKFGKNMVYVTKGLQTLNGEQALAYARNRKTWPKYCSKEWNLGERSDIVRGIHQQEVIQALIDKIKDIRSVDKVMELFDLVSSNIEMNMTQTDILSFYSVLKDIIAKGYSEHGDVINFQPLFLKTSGQMIYDESMKLVLSDQIINQGSLEDVIHAMKVNLELEEPTMIKTFSFSINSPYEKARIGDGNYSATRLYPLLPDFTGKTKAYAASWGQQNGIQIIFANNSNGLVVSQNYPAKKRLDLIPNKTVTLTLESNNSSSTTTDKIDCATSPDNNACIMPNFVGKNKTTVQSWVNKLKNVQIVYNEVSVAMANGNSVGTIIKQSIAEGQSIRSTKTITLTIVAEDETPTPSPTPTSTPKPTTSPEEKETTKKEQSTP